MFSLVGLTMLIIIIDSYVPMLATEESAKSINLTARQRRTLESSPSGPAAAPHARANAAGSCRPGKVGSDARRGRVRKLIFLLLEMTNHTNLYKHLIKI